MSARGTALTVTTQRNETWHAAARSATHTGKKWRLSKYGGKKQVAGCFVGCFWVIHLALAGRCRANCQFLLLRLFPVNVPLALQGTPAVAPTT